MLHMSGITATVCYFLVWVCTKKLAGVITLIELICEEDQSTIFENGSGALNIPLEIEMRYDNYKQALLMTEIELMNFTLQCVS